VLVKHSPSTDASVSEFASERGERLPARSQGGVIADSGGLVDLYQRCSSPVLSWNFVAPQEHFGDSLRGAIDPVTPYLCEGWRLQP
jgi:hypothetical protein